MKRFGLKIGIDVDDVLFACNEYAVELANKEFGFQPPIACEEIVAWGSTGNFRSDCILEYYKQDTFFKQQPVIEGAREFIETLQCKAEVFFVTAVPPEFMGIRAKRLIETFPTVPKENIIMGSKKELIQMDMLLDDGAHNIIASKTAYPVLFRKPWNQHMTGCLSVNNYSEFLTLVDSVLNEITMYAGECYGSCINDIEKALCNNNVVMALDICGAIAMKRAFPDKAVIVFVRRDKKTLIQAILERDISVEDKSNRIISLSDELKNEELCDVVVVNNESLKDVVDEFIADNM